jgi:hypothetical protein
MTSYQHFRPGSSLSNKKHLNKLIRYNSNLPFNNLEANIENQNLNYLCNCFKETVNKTKQGYNDPSQTNAERFSQLTINALGGRTMFGNNNNPVNITYLGGIEGQPGGIPRPLRNRF